jgi:hypothetical protein
MTPQVLYKVQLSFSVAGLPVHSKMMHIRCAFEAEITPSLFWYRFQFSYINALQSVVTVGELNGVASPLTRALHLTCQTRHWIGMPVLRVY